MATLSQNVAQAISDLSSIKTAIQAKGVTVPANTPTSQYGSLIGDIPSGANFEQIKALIERPTGTTFDIPHGITQIGSYALYYCTYHTVTVPSSVTQIKTKAFFGSSIYILTLSEGLQSIEQDAIRYCNQLTSLTIPASVTSVSTGGIGNCSDLSSLTILPTAAQFQSTAFYNCVKLSTVTLSNGFDCLNLNLSYSTLYTEAMIVSWLNALKDNTGQTAKTLTIGAANLAKLTAEEIAIATNKNWNLA
ncbi:MAG: leucine-rich repeat domain-containing protein [Ruminococcus sp.]|nr:leucine-rich repeat domain-containing protein [Ruminococcus sp.]